MGGAHSTAWMLFIAFQTTSLFAITPLDVANAHIAIAQARIEIGKQQPDFPDQPPRAEAPVLNKVDPPDSQGFVSDTGRRKAAGEQDAHAERKDALTSNTVTTVANKTAIKSATPMEASCLVRVGEPNKSAYLGSGTVISSNDSGSDVLTCWHIGRGVQKPEASIEFMGKSYPAKPLKLSQPLDLALYHVEEPLPHVDVATELPGFNWPVSSIGLNTMKQSNLLDIDKANIPTCLVTDAIELEGRSGGGLFFGRKLIGVIKERADSLKRSRYVALEEIEKFLKEDAPKSVPLLTESKVLPQIMVMTCDPDFICTEHVGKLIRVNKITVDGKPSFHSLIDIDADTLEKYPNAKVTAVTIGSATYKGVVTGIQKHVATVQVNEDLSRPSDVAELPQATPRIQFPEEILPTLTEGEFRPMRMIPIAQGSGPVPEYLPAQLVIGGWERGCPVCDRIKREVRVVLTPLNWRIGESSDDQIQFVNIPQTFGAPEITLYQNGEKLKTWSTYQDPAFLSNELKKAWESAPHPTHVAEATGTAGAIHASDQILNGFAYFRKYVGEGNPGSFLWDRSEAKLNLFQAKEWQAKDLFGLSGRMQLDAPNAINLPLKTLAFTYQLIGRDIKLDMEPIVLAGLIDKLNPNPSKVAGFSGVHPVGLFLLDDALFMYSVFGLIRDIVAVLHPSADVILPDQIAASGVLNGDTLTIKFDKAPKIRLTWVFTIALTVQKVTITAEKVTVFFSGSRFIRSREFAVQ